MKPRRGVELLPTISEMHEGDWEDGDPDLPTHSMQEYLDSIKELCQPLSYPLHGPLRGNRRWAARHALPLAAAASLVLPSSKYNPTMAYAPWTPVPAARVLPTAATTVSRRLDYAVAARPTRDPLDWLFAQSQFAGLT